MVIILDDYTFKVKTEVEIYLLTLLQNALEIWHRISNFTLNVNMSQTETASLFFTMIDF